MKNAVIYGAVAIGAYLLYKNMNPPAAVGDDLMLPPSGKTVTASGQTVGGLGYLNRNIPVYDAAPYQYRSAPINDFVPGMQGLGDLGRFSFKSVTHAVSNVVKAVAKAPASIVKTVANDVTGVVKFIAHPTMKGLVRLPGKLLSSTTQGLATGVFIPQKPTASSSSTAAGGTVYQDANGNIISKANYDALMLAAQAGTPQLAQTYKGYSLWTVTQVAPATGVLYLINYDASSGSYAASFNTMTDAKAAIDAVTTPTVAIAPPPPMLVPGQLTPPVPTGLMTPVVGAAIPYRSAVIYPVTADAGPRWVIAGDPTTAQANYGSSYASFPSLAQAQAAIDATMPSPASTYDATLAASQQAAAAQSASAFSPPPAMSTYDSTAAAAEQASMQTTADSGDYGPAPQASPALPETVTSIQTPGATFSPPPPAAASFSPPPPAAAPAPKSNAGLLVGGGILAALAAVVMHK